MKVVALISGGKDSCFAMMKCVQYGHQIVALANLMPMEDAVDELDSHMYQTVGHQIVVAYAQCMGLPLFRRRIHGSTRHQSLSYRTTPGDEVEDMFILLNEVKEQIPSISAVSTGAIASDYQRLRVESVCARLGLVSLAYLWKREQSLLLEEMISNGIIAIIVKVAALGLKPTTHLGRDLEQLQPLLLQLHEKYGINVCGEGGEYETLTLDCPLFVNARIVLDDFQVILHSPDSIASVGVLHPSAFHLEEKVQRMDNDSERADNSFDKVGFVHEVQGVNGLQYGERCQFSDKTPLESEISINGVVSISKTKGATYSICCWVKDTDNSRSRNLETELAVILQRIESELAQDGFGWADVFYVHLYIADINYFGSANETYVSFITEKKCHMGVPSRSTVELPLLESRFGKAFAEVLVTNSMSKRVLHVQSISCWAPSCIGPYSQASLHDGVLYMAGQLGLDPPTMNLCPGGAVAEIKQALKNCEAVANCYNCSLAGSAILFVVYCAASLSSGDKFQVQEQLGDFLKKISAEDLQFSLTDVQEPAYLYILASNLPKRALVEVKPLLISPIEKISTTASLENQDFTSEPNLWGFSPADVHKSCCQQYVSYGKICTAILSITDETAASVCCEADYSDELHVKKIVRLCILRLDQILKNHHFLWEELMYLRIYFSNKLWSAETLDTVCVDAFDEFARISNRMETRNGDMNRFFSLIPVVGSGSDAAFKDLITIEMLASKL